MDNLPLHFYPGAAGISSLTPLARYLPPLPAGMASGWLAENVPPGSWLLDPLGASPTLALEAARAGYRILVASNNPILTFIIETLATAPSSADFQSALAELAMSRRGEDRLEVHIKHLYQTECDACAETVQAQAFLWRKGETQPFARLYNCPRCGESGERPVTQADLDRLAAMGGDKLQRSRALQRVLMDEEEHRPDVEEALENYLSRPLYVLFTLLNKLEGLGLTPERTRILHALLISAFDSGSTLWPWPGGRSRPKQLIVPPQFRENNLWLALEEAVGEWAHQPGPVTVTHWPAQPPKTGGIALFRGRVKALMPLPEEIGPQAVLSVFPRPNQAFWTLSVLWSGWLWGPEAALPLRNVLDRRRYDWNWHTSAIHNALASVGWSIPPQTPFFGILPELAPGFLTATVVASQAGGFHLDGLALRPDANGRSEQEVAQALWRPAGGPPPAGKERVERGEPAAPGAEALETAAREAVRADLLTRNEPASYLIEYAAGLMALVRGGAIPRSLSSIPGDLLTRAQAVLARTFADRSLLRLYSARSESSPADEERGMWWLNEPPALTQNTALTLSDQIEMEVIRFMQKQSIFTFDDLDRAVCAQFSGLLTPPADLLRACLESYGESIPSQVGSWRMRTSETAVARKADLQDIRTLLEDIGQRLGFSTHKQGQALVWKSSQPEWWFYSMASSLISRFILAEPPGPRSRCVLILPASRARLLAYRLRRDPRLAEAAQGWRLLKIRHLRNIIAQPDLSPVTWETLLDEDPFTDEATQMRLFTNPQ